MIELFLAGFFKVRLLDVIDILLVAILIYEIYNLLKGTVAINIFLGIVAVFIIWKIVDILKMELLSDILGAFISVGFIALIVIFQPEIRQFLLTLGKPNFIQHRRRRFLFWKLNDFYRSELDIDKIVQACQKMANIKQGALIVMTRQHELVQTVETGEMIDAAISVELLENIFFSNSPLHDGAVIITSNRIKAAHCVLPISKSLKLTANIGLRHRAAVGITELSDSIAIVVSEQTGKISYAMNGYLTRNVQPSELQDFLVREFGNYRSTSGAGEEMESKKS
jgi:diadenylate cyclase